MTVLNSKYKNYKLEIGQGKAILYMDGKETLNERYFLKVELKNVKYHIESFLISGFKKAKISTGLLLKFLRTIGFNFSQQTFRLAIIKDLTLEERFRFNGLKKKEASVHFQPKNNILVFNGDFVRSVSEDFAKNKYVRLIYAESEKKIKVLFCEEKGPHDYVYKLTFHPNFCQMQITCTSFVKDHELPLNGSYTVKLSEDGPEWIIAL